MRTQIDDLLPILHSDLYRGIYSLQTIIAFRNTRTYKILIENVLGLPGIKDRKNSVLVIESCVNQRLPVSAQLSPKFLVTGIKRLNKCGSRQADIDRWLEHALLWKWSTMHLSRLSSLLSPIDYVRVVAKEGSDEEFFQVLNVEDSCHLSTALSAAAMKGNSSRIEWLIEKYEFTIDDFYEAYLSAICARHHKIAKTLGEYIDHLHGYDLNDLRGSLPTICRLGISITRYLTPGYGNTRSEIPGDANVVKEILDKIANWWYVQDMAFGTVRPSTRRTGISGNIFLTCWMTILDREDLEFMRTLLAYRRMFDFRPTGKFLFNSLKQLARKGNRNMLIELLQTANRHEMSFTTENLEMASRKAAEYGHSDLSQFLLTAGAR